MENTNFANRETDNYGDLEMVQSLTHKTLQITPISSITSEFADKEVLVRGRISNSRVKGNLAFLVVREGIHSVQSVAFKSETITKDMLKFIEGITKESIIDVYGKLVKTKNEVKTCSVKDLELAISKVFVLSRADVNLPFQLEDAMRKINNFENEEEEEKKEENALPTVSLKNRLDNRIIDMRTPLTQSIFRIQSGVCRFFRDYLHSQDFMEIHTPKLLAGSSEGGSNVFKFNFFKREGCLAQSPQLYKQMCIMGDFKRVFEIGPVFRAENSFTPRHLCEFTGLDFEMEIQESYLEVLEVIGNLFNHIFKNLKEHYTKELSCINEVYPFEDFKYLEKPLILTFEEGCKLLKEHGIEQSVHEDLDTVNEKTLGKLVREKYNTDFYILHRYPESARPFYTMLQKDDERFTCSYDVFMRGQEIISGAQRIHVPELLEKRAIAKGLQVESIKSYIDSFKFGASPHGGVGVGLERVVMLFTGLPSCKLTSLFPRDPKRLTP